MKNIMADPDIRFAVLILFAVAALMVLIAAAFGPLKFISLRFLTMWVFIPLGVLNTLICAFFAAKGGFAETRPIVFLGGGSGLWTLGLVLEVTEYGSKPFASMIQVAGLFLWFFATGWRTWWAWWKANWRKPI